MLPGPCKPPSAPVGLSLWAHSAKLDSVYRVHRHDRDPVYRVHDPGVYQWGGIGKTLSSVPTGSCYLSHQVLAAEQTPCDLFFCIYSVLSSQTPEKQWENDTRLVTEFVLVGFSNLPGLRTTLFTLFFLTYLVTLSGNVTIITIIHVDRTLHTPMYCFLAALSLSETCYTLVTIPNMLAHLLMESQAISIAGCRAQMFFFLGLGCSHCFLLTLMGYDRYVAICYPLRYSVIMRPTVCLCLGALVFCSGFSVAVIETTMIFSSTFCGRDRVEHFFCDIAPVLKLSCSESANKALVIFFLSILVVLVSFLLILLSYAFIVAAILKIPSAAGRRKAFSTCAAHLTVVIVHFGCASIIYLRPQSRGNPDQDRLVAVFYTVVTPLLNPVVYTLRNREVRVALRRTMARSCGFLNKH
ncbi:olfactory receptor 10T2-like [Rousettus aegyptiacus]|uniref:olfactory receptor 10T2-like n=1 Tax=Rousettus aegyptiacus TaxID=9407 RepID=UPI00168D22A2|nr:olfactory receptor 10T2-like [Rousettus aegyptiacus]